MTSIDGANDGARTRDNQNHNLGLYQLSYVRHSRVKIIAFTPNYCQKTLFSLHSAHYSSDGNSKPAQSPRVKLASKKKSAIAARLWTLAKAW